MNISLRSAILAIFELKTYCSLSAQLAQRKDESSSIKNSFSKAQNQLQLLAQLASNMSIKSFHLRNFPKRGLPWEGIFCYFQTSIYYSYLLIQQCLPYQLSTDRRKGTLLMHTHTHTRARQCRFYSDGHLVSIFLIGILALKVEFLRQLKKSIFISILNKC